MVRKKLAAQGFFSLSCLRHSLCQMPGPWFLAVSEGGFEGGAVPGRLWDGASSPHSCAEGGTGLG